MDYVTPATSPTLVLKHFKKSMYTLQIWIQPEISVHKTLYIGLLSNSMETKFCNYVNNIDFTLLKLSYMPVT